MIRWLHLLKTFPKWVVSALIVLVSLIVFIGWWTFRKPAARTSASTQPTSASLPVKIPEFRPEDVVLCGNTLVNFHTGEIIARQWLEGGLDSAPPLVRYLPDEKLVIGGNRGMAKAFSLDGKGKPLISFEGKPLLAAAYDFQKSTVLFVREGNLWRGHVDWQASTIANATRVTDVGYFRDDTFKGDWYWYDDALFVPVMGKTQIVDLDSGSVTPESVPIGRITRHLSPDGSTVAVSLGAGKLLVVDQAKEERKEFSIRGGFKEMLWLDSVRLAVSVGSNGVAICNTTTGQVSTTYEAPSFTQQFIAVSPKGESLIVLTRNGPTIFRTTNGKFTPIGFAIDCGEWISETTLLVSNSSTDTRTRGVWLVDTDDRKEPVSNQPVDPARSTIGKQTIITIPGGVVWISGGNLWRFDLDTGAAKQLTQGQHLPASLQLIPVK
jgi:hypothetical protein